jgi:hypothetical protein
LETLSLGQVPGSLIEIRQKAENIASKVVDFLERRTVLCLILMVLGTLPLSPLVARLKPLDNDELYTYRIAQQPSVGNVIGLSRTIDLHPPMHYLWVREALKLPLPRRIGARLPSMLALQLSMICVFWLLKRQFGNAVGLLGAAVLWFTGVTDFSWYDRPYALWVFFLCLVALLWTVCIEEGRKWWHIAALALAGCSMALTHMFGLSSLMPFYLAEAARYSRRRRADWPVWIALSVPCLVALTYIHQVQGVSPNSFPTRYIPSFSQAVDSYERLIDNSAWALVGSVIVAFLIMPRGKPTGSRKGFPREYWVLAWGLFLMPLVIELAAKIHTYMFSYRYGICGTVGIALLGSLAIARYVPGARIAGALLLLGLFIGLAIRIDIDARAFDPDDLFNLTGLDPKPLETLDPSYPIVVAAAEDFTELNDREPPEILNRLYYLTDFESAKKYSGQTIFENEEATIPLLGLKGKAEPMLQFFSEHQSFFLVSNYTSTHEWLTRYLIEHGAHVELQGKFVRETSANDVYFVTVESKSLAQTSGHPASP